jgi:hypothetical protein
MDRPFDHVFGSRNRGLWIPPYMWNRQNGEEQMTRGRIVATLGGVLAAGSAYAGPTGCASIPIADILRHREAASGYFINGTERNVDRAITHSAYLLVGLFDRIEVGLDTDFNGSNVYNAKILLYESPDAGRIALSAGVQNWNGSASAEPYLVGRYDLPFCRLHVGALKQDSWRAIVGLDFPIFGDGSGMIDFTSGPGSRIWTGIFLPIPKVDGLAFEAYAGFPTQRSEGIQWSVGLSFAFRF